MFDSDEVLEYELIEIRNSEGYNDLEEVKEDLEQLEEELKEEKQLGWGWILDKNSREIKAPGREEYSSWDESYDGINIQSKSVMVEFSPHKAEIIGFPDLPREKEDEVLLDYAEQSYPNVQKSVLGSLQEYVQDTLG